MKQKPKYNHNTTMAAYRKADRTAFGKHHGNKKRNVQHEATTANSHKHSSEK